MTTGRIDVVAEPIQQGRTLQLWQVVLTRADDGKLVARGQVRLQNVPLPGGPRRARWIRRRGHPPRERWG